MTHTFHAESLADIADQFDKFAEGADVKAAYAEQVSRQNYYRTEARTWREAADVLRHTKLQPPSNVEGTDLS